MNRCDVIYPGLVLVLKSKLLVTSVQIAGYMIIQIHR